MKYSEKLKDPRWQRKRLEILQRDDWACQCCRDKASTLQVHHKQYHGNPWDAPDDSLETLCEECHANRTSLNKLFLGLDSKKANEIGALMAWSSEQIQSARSMACDAYSYNMSKSDAQKERSI